MLITDIVNNFAVERITKRYYASGYDELYLIYAGRWIEIEFGVMTGISGISGRHCSTYFIHDLLYKPMQASVGDFYNDGLVE